MQNPFHEGELKVQRLVREESMAERNGSLIADRIMGGALPFLAQQSMVVFGSRDGQGRLWASMLFGSRGFMKSADGRSVDFDLSLVAVQQHDPFWQNIEANPTVGMLAIELGSRRRIRINGDISRPTENTLQLGVREAFANCPKYITRRMVKTVATGEPLKSEMNSGRTFGPVQEHLLGREMCCLLRLRIQRAEQTHRIAAATRASLKCWTKKRCAFRIMSATVCSTRSATWLWIPRPDLLCQILNMGALCS